MASSDTLQLPPDFGRFSSFIEGRLEAFTLDDEEARNVALSAAKSAFELVLQDELANKPYISDLLASITQSQPPQTRSKARASATAKRSPKPPAISHAILEPTPLSGLFVDGMDEAQIWAQLDMKVKNVCDTLHDAFVANERPDDGSVSSEGESFEENMLDGEDVDFDEMDVDEDGPSVDVAGSDSEYDEDDDEDDSDADGEDPDLGESMIDLRDSSGEDEEDEEEEELELESRKDTSPKNRDRTRPNGGGHPELDDDFFKLADFNAEIEEAEALHVSGGALGEEVVSDSEDESVDLFAPINEPEAFEEEDMDDFIDNPNYHEFFDPPPRPSKPKKVVASEKEKEKARATKVRFHAQVKVKNIKSKGKGRPVSYEGGDDDDDDDYALASDLLMEEDDDDDSEMQNVDEGSDEEGSLDIPFTGKRNNRETMERLNDDLFAEDEDPLTDLSAHEARMSELQKQIADLEAENIGDKHWTLMGEASANSRPTNALLEETLSFEQVQKSVPVMTQEVIEKLEDRIKKRILDGVFDDVIRKAASNEKTFLPSRRFELQDTKSTQTLMQVYEKEYVAAQTGGYVGDDRDAKLKKEHEEIEAMWDSICYKLDSLCNAHFTPKPPQAIVSTIPNVSTITMESVMPTTQSAATALTPKELSSGASPKRRPKNSKKRTSSHIKVPETAKKHTKVENRPRRVQSKQ